MKIQKKGRRKMFAKTITISFLVFMCLLLFRNSTFSATDKAFEAEKQEFKQDLSKIEARQKSLARGQENDLNSYEKFCDEIQVKWTKGKNEERAHLMLKVCKPLSAGRFKEARRYEVARKYALSALADANNISLETELKLTGHVVTLMIGPGVPEGEKWVQARKKDVQIRLHAWKRLSDAIDPTWDPNEELMSPNGVGASLGIQAGGIAPEDIKDPGLRAKYKAALEKNQKKIERYTQQSRLRKWLKRYPKTTEKYIVRAYSKDPYDTDELKRFLQKYKIQEQAKLRILEAVTRNIEKQNKVKPDG
jgi:hypothetical protein